MRRNTIVAAATCKCVLHNSQLTHYGHRTGILIWNCSHVIHVWPVNECVRVSLSVVLVLRPMMIIIKQQSVLCRTWKYSENSKNEISFSAHHFQHSLPMLNRIRQYIKQTDGWTVMRRTRVFCRTVKTVASTFDVECVRVCMCICVIARLHTVNWRSHRRRLCQMK